LRGPGGKETYREGEFLDNTSEGLQNCWKTEREKLTRVRHLKDAKEILGLQYHRGKGKMTEGMKKRKSYKIFGKSSEEKKKKTPQELQKGRCSETEEEFPDRSRS